MVAIALLLPAFAAAADKAPSDLVLFRKVVVVVHDTFIDPARFEPRRMLVGAMRAFADASAGALEVTADSDAIVVRAGGVEGRFKSTTRSIWDVPLQVREMLLFVNSVLPELPIDRRSAELAIVQGFLATLDPPATLLAPDASPAGAWVEAHLLPGGVEYVQLLRFDGHALSQVTEAISQARAVILDLRGSRGGLLPEIREIADLFISDGVMFTVTARQGRNRIVARAGGAGERLPIALLVDRWTGSGAELLAASLVVRGRAITLGQRTPGRSEMQLAFPLKDRESGKMYVLVLAVARCVAGESASIDGRGVAPDVDLPPAAPAVGASDPWIALAADLLTEMGSPDRDKMIARLPAFLAAHPSAADMSPPPK